MTGRWLRFNAVGIAGALVQLAVLWLLRSGLGLPVWLATVLAVEVALLHNFFWHERWTWRTVGEPGRGARLWRFHAANGAVSIASNLVWMRVLAGTAGLPYLPANAIAITLTALLNFALGERFVFRPAR